MAAQEAGEGWDTNANTNAAPAPDSKWDAGDENPSWKSDAAVPTGDGFGDDFGNGSGEGFGDNFGDAAPQVEAEPEDTHKSYADYLAEQAAKRMEGLGVKEARAPNEGAKDSKWKSAKELSKEDEEAAYFRGKEDKARRERDRTRNAKERLADFTYNVADTDSTGQRGGRGRGRGRGERGEYRGRGERGEYRGRGRGDRDRDGEGYRGRSEGYRGRGDRGEYRGRARGRGGRDGSGQIPAVPVNDESAFPSLGGPK